MYITDTSNKVKELFEKLESMDDIKKLEILMSIFNLINNNQINNKNEENPDLVEDNDLIIFNMESIGFTPNYCTIFLQYNLMEYNLINENSKLYENNGNILGFKYNNDVKEFVSAFEKLSFNDKLDMIAEIIIRYDNETYLSNNKTHAILDGERSGFDIAREIKKLKQSL